MNLFFFAALFFAQVQAQTNLQVEEKSAFETELSHYSDYQTRERWVQHNGSRYREVEFDGKKYYIKFAAQTGDSGELDCRISSDKLNPSEIESGVEIMRRSKLFVSFVQETCVIDARGQSHKSVRLDPRLGFKIPDGKHSAITNKKVYLSPEGLGFSGDY